MTFNIYLSVRMAVDYAMLIHSPMITIVGLQLGMLMNGTSLHAEFVSFYFVLQFKHKFSIILVMKGLACRVLIAKEIRV